MMKSKEVQSFNAGGLLTHRNNVDVKNNSVDDQGTIPLRYQDGMGGIDIEQVRRDQRQAQQQFIRAILRHLRRQR
ncbi:hypothetical protein [Halomonas sp. hl-4]|uniref:hypothetical protein n=1 Tax=Halomonas sp. hl-4 TaxID=1761789 RepID=UPI000BB878B8|nr:hypothetical protein [Halomonas sp. hl-4]SNY99113.1 hypothetical protein SAMN04488142_3750 [Halomonas sp. hl-4]